MRTKHPRARLLAVVLSLSALLAAAAPVHAAAPPLPEVNLFECSEAGEEITVPSGTAFNIVDGWFAKTLWQDVMFLLSVKVVVGLNGVPIAHPARYWNRPFFSADDGVWLVWWKYPHAALAAGDSIVFTEAWSFRFPVWDGFVWTPRGPFIDEKCTITAA